MASTLKPRVKLVGEDGNVFAIIGRVTSALRRAGERERASEFAQAAMHADSYGRVLQLAMEFCDIE